MASAAERNDPCHDRDPLTAKVIGAAIEVHRAIGPGLLESAYAECLAHELTLLGIPFEREMPVPLRYKAVRLECAYRLDFMVEQSLVVELKCVEQFEPAHEAQLLTYMRLLGVETGLLLNFRALRLKDGIMRRKLFPTKTSVPSLLPSARSA